MDQEDQVLNFMQITECQDYEKSKSYIQMSNNNLEVMNKIHDYQSAISLFMEMEGQISSNNSMMQEEGKTQGQGIQFPTIKEANQPKQIVGKSQNQSQPQQDSRSMIERYKQFKREKDAKDEGIVKKMYGKTVQAFSSMFNGPKDNGEEFQKIIQKSRMNLEVKFQTGNFEQNLEKAQEHPKPLLIYVHHISQVKSNKNIVRILSNTRLAQFINQTFHCLGLLNNSESILQLKEQGFNFDKVPGLYVYRRNLFEEIEQIGEIELLEESDTLSITKTLKSIMAQYNKLYMQEEKIKKDSLQDNDQSSQSSQSSQFSQNQFQDTQSNNMQQVQYPQDAQARISQQQLKIQQEKILRQQQENAFKQAEQDAKNKLQKKTQEDNHKKQLEIEQFNIQEKKLLERASRLSNLPDEPKEDGSLIIQFQFRMPNGNLLERKFKGDSTVQNLFDYIGCQDESYFENEDSGFDLIQNYPKLSLLEYQQNQLGEVFQETLQQQLIVKEL